MNKPFVKKAILAGVALGLWAHSSAAAGDIRDVKGPVGLPAHFFWLLIVFLIAAIAVLLYWMWRKKIFLKKRTPVAPVKTPLERARERFAALLNSDLLTRGAFEEYYLRLSDIVRRYFEEQFAIKAPEMTTEEFLTRLKNSAALNTAQKDTLKSFLTACDMVKFARYASAVEEAREHTQLAQRLVDETNKEPVQA